MFHRLQTEAEHLIKSVVHLVYYMRGSIQYNDVMLHRTSSERDIMFEFIGERLEAEKKSMYPVY